MTKNSDSIFQFSVFLIETMQSCRKHLSKNKTIQFFLFYRTQKRLFDKFCGMSFETFLADETAKIVCFAVIRNFELSCIFV